MAAFDAYRRQDRAAMEELLAPDYRFTSPQDDHIDRAAFMERCFPTADRFVRHEIVHVVAGRGGSVFVMYEYELRDGAGTYRNVEYVTVRGGRLVETQVFFGGKV